MFDFDYKSKYSPKQAAQIDQDGRHINIKLENKKEIEKSSDLCDWVKGLKLDLKNDIIISWNKENLCFHHLSGLKAGKLLFYVKDLQSKESEITDVLINMDYRYYYISTTLGHVCVFKFDNTKKLVHTFTGHYKSIASMIPLR